MSERYGLKAIVIDYLQLLTAPGAARESRQNEVSTISRQIKALARELKVPVLCLAQLNRGAEQRDAEPPPDERSPRVGLDRAGRRRRRAAAPRGVLPQRRRGVAQRPRQRGEAQPHRADHRQAAERADRRRQADLGRQATVRFKNYDWRHSGYGGYAGGGDTGGVPYADAPPAAGSEPPPFSAQDAPYGAGSDEPPEVHVPPGAGSRFAPGRQTGPVSDHRDGGGPDRGHDDYEDDDDLPPA
jgi:hypothetical protein